MRFADFPFLRYLPFLVSGVLLSQSGLGAPVWVSAAVIGGLWLLYLFLLLGKKTPSKLGLALLGYAMLFVLGALLSEGQKKRAARALDPALEFCEAYLARVEKYDVQKPNSQENLLEVIQLRDSSGWKASKGKVLVYHKSAKPLLPGQVLLVSKSPEQIPPPSFPNEFDYRTFLARKDIHFRQFVGKEVQMVDRTESGDFRFWLERTRRSLVMIIQRKVLGLQAQQIATALLLGQKESLDRELRDAYAQTGTMHILAVSGLHVGIIYVILLFPLKGLRLGKRPRKIYLLFVVLSIWVYAVLTGFSPSVVRAATMFTLFSLGQMRERKPSSWNVLAFSAMLIIAMDPGVVFDVGFQLSYSAVAGILLLQPLIVRWWLPPNRVVEYFWQITAVSIAAQLGTFPLSILYFHSFPSYFLLANLLIIPLSFLVMNVGIAMLALNWVPFLGNLLGWIVSGLIWLQNWLTVQIQQLPGGNMERLTITLTGMLLVWGLLIVWANWEWGDRRKLVYLMIGLFLAWRAERLGRELRQPASELLVFSGEKGLLMDFKVGDQHFSWNESFPLEQISFSVDPNRVAAHRPRMSESALTFDEEGFRYFPIFGFRFGARDNSLHWEVNRPRKVERLLPDGGTEALPLDSLSANNGAFRVVF